MITAESIIENIAKLSEQVLTFANEQTDEFNGIMDIVDDRDAAILEQHETIIKQHEALEVQQKREEKILNANDSMNGKAVIFENENKSLKHQIAVLKKEAKAQKEQTKRNQKSIKAKEARIAKLEKASKSDLQMQQLTTVYHKGDDQLIIYPQRLELGIAGERTQQSVLLYTNGSGCFVTAFLDKQHEIHFSTFINDLTTIKEQTRKLINKNTMGVPTEVAEFAESWLYRVNIMQKMKLEQRDLVCVK